MVQFSPLMLRLSSLNTSEWRLKTEIGKISAIRSMMQKFAACAQNRDVYDFRKNFKK